MPRQRPDIPSLPMEKLAEELRAAGMGPIVVGQILADLANGAPSNADGTIDPIHYAAWLIQERGDRVQQAK